MRLVSENSKKTGKERRQGKGVLRPDKCPASVFSGLRLKGRGKYIKSVMTNPKVRQGAATET